MPPLVAPGVCRFSSYGTIFDRPWACIIDMHIDSQDGSERPGYIADQAEVINNEWIDHLRPRFSSDWRLLGTKFVDLNSLTGVTGDVTTATAPRTMPSVGAGVANGVPPNTALLVKKMAAGGRSARNGRWYLAGITETQVAGNNITASELSPYQTGLNDFRSGINQSGKNPPPLTGTYDSELVVVHTTAGVFTSFTPVTSLQAQARPASQRRRLRG